MSRAEERLSNYYGELNQYAAQSISTLEELEKACETKANEPSWDVQLEHCSVINKRLNVMHAAMFKPESISNKKDSYTKECALMSRMAFKPCQRMQIAYHIDTLLRTKQNPRSEREEQSNLQDYQKRPNETKQNLQNRVDSFNEMAIGLLSDWRASATESSSAAPMDIAEPQKDKENGKLQTSVALMMDGKWLTRY